MWLCLGAKEVGCAKDYFIEKNGSDLLAGNIAHSSLSLGAGAGISSLL